MALFQHLSYRFEFSGHLILQKLCKCIDVTAFFLAIIYAKSAEDYVKLMYYEKEEKYKSKRKNNKENATN